MDTKQTPELSRILQLLYGLDPNWEVAGGNIVWLKTAEFDPCHLKDDDVIFSAVPINRPYFQLLGEIGQEGDEAVFGDGLIVETSSLSGLDYMDILGPTYVSFESLSDEEKLRDMLLSFQQTGKLHPYFTDPALIYDLGSFISSGCEVSRTIIDESGVQPWPVAPAISKIKHEFPGLSRWLVGSVLMSRFLGAEVSDFVFDLPSNPDEDIAIDLVLAHDDSQYRCMSLESGKHFALGYDMYRALLSVLNPGKFAVLPGRPLDDASRAMALNKLKEKIANGN